MSLQSSELQNTWQVTFSISCIRDTYNIFLVTTIQLGNVVRMCYDSDNVPYIDTTFNLFSSWVTKCCYINNLLKTNEGKHPIFSGSTTVHFEKDVFSKLKAIEPDLENGKLGKFMPRILQVVCKQEKSNFSK